MRENLKFAPAAPAAVSVGGVTLINVFETTPERQDEVLRLLAEINEAQVKARPGFVSSVLHFSLDGRRVVNYAEWESREAWLAMANDPEIRAALAPVLQLASVQAGAYEVASTHKP